MPTLLAIETSGETCSAAVFDGAQMVLHSARVGNAHSEHLLGMVQAVLDRSDIALAGCDALAFSAGPGSFTGLRVGCAVAQGLAFGADLPVVQVGTLIAVADSLPREILFCGARIIAAQDARMGEVYWSALTWHDDGWRVDVPASLASPIALREESFANGGAAFDIGCGNAWAMHGVALGRLAARVVHRDAPDASQIARLGLLAWQRGEAMAAEAARPEYVRDRVAQTTIEREAARMEKYRASSETS